MSHKMKKVENCHSRATSWLVMRLWLGLKNNTALGKISVFFSKTDRSDEIDLLLWRKYPSKLLQQKLIPCCVFIDPFKFRIHGRCTVGINEKGLAVQKNSIFEKSLELINSPDREGFHLQTGLMWNETF